MYASLFYVSVVVCFATSIIVAVSTVKYFINQRKAELESKKSH